MKRFVSLALAAAMTLSIAPVAAFADTNNRVVGSPVVSKDDVFGTDITDDKTPEIVIQNNKGDIKTGTDLEFALVLDGAEFDDSAKLQFAKNQDEFKTIDNLTGQVEVSEYNSSKIYIKIPAGSTLLPGNLDEELKIRLTGVKVTGDTAKVTIDGTNSVVYTSTHTFAKSADGNAIITVDGKKDFPDGGAVNDIIIEEVTNSSIDTSVTDTKIKLKLNSGFEFKYSDSKAPQLQVVKGGSTGSYTLNKTESGGRDLVFDLDSDFLDNGAISVIKITGIEISEDGAKYGDVAEITVSGEGGAKDITKTTLEMGKYIDYGVNVSTEDKDLPVIYSGRTVDGDNNQTLKLTVKEGVADSWFVDTRKTTFTFPEGVKVESVEVDSKSNIKALEDKDFIKDGNVVTLSNVEKSDSKDKTEAVLIFNLEVAPNFTGDITCEVGGPAVSENQKVTLAKAVAPVTVEATKTPVSIDYRNVAVGDITLTEAEAGLWKKGEKITLDVENMSFESGIKAEVVEGDGDIKKLDVNKSSGTVTIEVDSESSKTPMKIKLSGISLYLDRTLPVGDYALSLVTGEINDNTDLKKTSVMFQNYNSKDGNKPGTDFGFDVDEVEVMKDYVTVTTAGRDQGTTFTTEVVVTIDSTTMKVDGKDVTLDTPAYLSAEGWTMLPIRAVTEALATTSNTQPVDWIPGNPGTIIIRYGDKTVSMTLGSTTMYINGTPIPMSTAPTIVNDRAFLPMRDLGRALGLTENEIVWDAATRTATLNPSTTNTTTNQ